MYQACKCLCSPESGPGLSLSLCGGIKAATPPQAAVFLLALLFQGTKMLTFFVDTLPLL